MPKSKVMFAASEQWRKDFKVDELYETFDYQEREAVNQIYPQFYHKTDKVWLTCIIALIPTSLAAAC